MSHYIDATFSISEWYKKRFPTNLEGIPAKLKIENLDPAHACEILKMAEDWLWMVFGSAHKEAKLDDDKLTARWIFDGESSYEDASRFRSEATKRAQAQGLELVSIDLVDASVGANDS